MSTGREGERRCQKQLPMAQKKQPSGAWRCIQEKCMHRSPAQDSERKQYVGNTRTHLQNSRQWSDSPNLDEDTQVRKAAEGRCLMGRPEH